MVHTVVKLIRVWLLMSVKVIQESLLSTWASFLFLLGKVVRLLLYIIFLSTVVTSSKGIAGYTYQQVILFFLIFNIIDTSAQLLYRGTYWFRNQVVSGDFDLDLLKPLPSFFRPLFGWTDVLDLITLVPLWIYFIWYGVRNGLITGLDKVILFLVMFVNSLVLSFAFHLFVCAVCVLTTEIDHMVMVYRDLTGMARFPTDIYSKGIQIILTYTIPVVILVTVPAKAILGLLSWQMAAVSLLVTGVFLWVSLRFWRFALARYSSASS